MYSNGVKKTKYDNNNNNNNFPINFISFKI